MSYRDEVEAARARRDAIARQLEATRLRLSELEPLGEEARTLERLLEDADRDIASARARAPSPLLSRVRVASPCNASWSDMTGDAHARHCRLCDKTVYDLSSLTAAQAEALLQAHGEQLCVRFYRRADGTILTADCPVGARKRKVRLAVIAGATALATAVGTAAGALGLVMDEPRPTCTVRDRHGVGVNGDHDPSPYVPTRNVGAEHHLEPVQGGASLVMGQAIAAE